MGTTISTHVMHCEYTHFDHGRNVGIWVFDEDDSNILLPEAASKVAEMLPDRFYKVSCTGESECQFISMIYNGELELEEMAKYVGLLAGISMEGILDGGKHYLLNFETNTLEEVKSAYECPDVSPN